MKTSEPIASTVAKSSCAAGLIGFKDELDCGSCGRKFSKSDDLLVAGDPCPSDDCPSHNEELGKKYADGRASPSESTAKLDVHHIVSDVLGRCGWVNKTGVGLGSKAFDTAVGQKVAFAMLSAGDGFNRTLSGDYQSEGRNALESSGVLIPEASSDAQIEAFASKFAAQVESAVAQTYAAKLLLGKQK